MSSENKSAGGLKTRALATGAWSLAATGSVYALRLGSNLIMTRLLMPEAFGLIALVGVIVSGLEMFTDVGIKRSVIRENDGDTTHFLRVAWTVKILRASVIAGVVLIIALGLALAAPLFPEASTYAQPELPGLLAMAALSPILIGATSTASELLQRQMQMKLLVIYGILSRVLSIIGMVIFAWIWPSVWALLAGMLLANLFSFLSSHLLLPGPRMALSWDPEIGDRLWKFGRWIMASSILTFFSNNADRLILAALLPASTFGIYAISQTWMSAGTSLLQRLNDQVGFPAVAEVIRTRRDRLPELQGRYQRVMDLLCLTAFLGCLIFGPLFISLLYTDTYHEAGRYMSLLAPVFLFFRFVPLSQLLLNLGDSRSGMILAAIRAITAIIGVPLGFQAAGIEGVIVAVVLSRGLGAVYTIYRVHPILGGRRTVVHTAWFTIAVIATLLTAVMR